MSRVGKQPIVVPKGVKVTLLDGSLLVEGPKGKLSLAIPEAIKIEVSADKIVVTRINDQKQSRSLHGTIRALIYNMVKGVTEAYKRELDVVGVGYKAQMKGATLVLNLQFSHPVEVAIPAGLKVVTPNPNRIVAEGIDKQQVSEFVSKVRKVFPPEPYQGKGIRFVGETVKKKLGKALAK
ncbi:MAG: 50S ribosomal protein L6 [Candidatus Omnitrophota bacterium]|nr:50S ribosomal protein L6 [Candidatus Omnitrophota bacterium]